MRVAPRVLILFAGAAAAAGNAAAQSVPASSPATIAKAAADSARYPWTEADRHFMTGMISHHAQAIRMAGWAPTHGANSAIKTLCERIINAQQDEIAAMQIWLADRRQPVPAPDPAGMKMDMNGMQHVMLMPGMLTEAQMAQLDKARGKEFDRLFLTYMIQHHQGAVSMVAALLATAGAGQDAAVYKFASDVSVDQTTEIERMQQMLASLPPGLL